MKNLGWTLAEIEKYYGGLEAYNEEQRRCRLIELEEVQRNGPVKLFKPGYDLASVERSRSGSAHPQVKSRLRFRFFGAK
jgi:hypothetical protein